MRPSIKGEIINIEPESEYAGTIYDQTVRVRTNSGTFDWFDKRALLDQDDRGDVVDFILLARPWKISVVAELPESGIKQDKKIEEDRSKWSCTLSGEIVNPEYHFEGSDDTLLLLDVGFGTVLVARTSELTEMVSDKTLKSGSAVQIECSRVDVVGRNNAE